MKIKFNTKKTITAVIVILIVFQFFQPSKNEGEAFGENDILHAANVPEEVKNVLVNSCYDCHSDRTNHKWYEKIQPIGWWIGHHIKDGKRHLNFSEFNTYKDKRKAHKLEELAEMVNEGEMPMTSYTLMHSNAKLSDAQKKLLVEWANTERARYPEEEHERN